MNRGQKLRYGAAILVCATSMSMARAVTAFPFTRSHATSPSAAVTLYLNALQHKDAKLAAEYSIHQNFRTKQDEISFFRLEFRSEIIGGYQIKDVHVVSRSKAFVQISILDSGKKGMYNIETVKKGGEWICYFPIVTSATPKK